MADPLLIPESQAALGQSPYSGIQGPGIGVSVPQGIDSSALYNSLASINDGLQTAMLMRQQYIQEAKDEADRIDALNKSMQDAFDQMMAFKGLQGDNSVGGLPGLDSTYAGPRRVNEEISGIMRGLNDKMDAIRKTAVQPGELSNPRDAAEFQRQLSTAVNEAKLSLAENQDYIRYSRALQAKDSLDDQIAALRLKGQDVSPRYFELRRKFDDYLNEVPGATISDADLEAGQYVYNPKQGYTKLQADLKQRFSPIKRSVVEDVNGNKVERVVTTTPRVDDVIDDLETAWSGDKDIRGMYETSVLGGYKGSFRDWLRTTAKAFEQPEQTDFGTKLYTVPRPYDRRPGDGDGDESATGYQGPRTYTTFEEADQSGAEAAWVKDKHNITSSSANEAITGTEIHRDISDMGFEPQSTVNVQAVMNAKKAKKPVKYKYDKYEDQLRIFTVDDPGSYYAKDVQIGFVRDKFTDFEDNEDIPNKAGTSSNLEDYYIPPEIDVIRDEDLKRKVFNNVERPSDRRLLGRYTTLLDKVHRGTATKAEWKAVFPNKPFNAGTYRYSSDAKKREARLKVLREEIEKFTNQVQRNEIGGTEETDLGFYFD